MTNDIERLIDYAIVQFITDDIVFEHIKRHDKAKVLAVLNKRLQRNEALKYKLLEIAANGLSDYAKSWVRDNWRQRKKDELLITFLWWMTIPVIFIMALFITPFVRSLTWKQIIFTYIVPLVPLFFAWDGAVSNVRTYTFEDLDILLKGLESEDYKWEKGKISKRGNKVDLLGIPTGK